MVLLRIMPFLALAAVLVSLLATAVWHEDRGTQTYESPCIVSWDENDGDATFCIMTPEAAAKEKAS